MGPPFEQLARDVSTTGKSPCGCISATYSQLRRYLWVLFGIFALEMLRKGPASGPQLYPAPNLRCH